MSRSLETTLPSSEISTPASHKMLGAGLIATTLGLMGFAGYQAFSVLSQAF